MRPDLNAAILVTNLENERVVCEVTELLSIMCLCTYEVRRADGGWRERVLFVPYANIREENGELVGDAG